MSLLHRKRQPPPLPPENLLVGLGPGDYWHHGEWTVGLIEQLVGVRRDDTDRRRVPAHHVPRAGQRELHGQLR